LERINERLEKLLIKIREKSFRENRGLGNEVGFHVFDYDPEDELVVRDGIKQIKSKATSQELQIQEFDLFEVMLEILGGKGFLQKTFQMEKNKGTEGLTTTNKIKARAIEVKNQVNYQLAKRKK